MKTGWFYCKSDFEVSLDSAFQLERARNHVLSGSGRWRRQQRIRQFWHRYLLALMSVKGGYSFYAVDTSDGAVAYACAPEFEEVESAAPSFLEFLELITAGRARF